MTHDDLDASAHDSVTDATDADTARGDVTITGVDMVADADASESTTQAIDPPAATDESDDVRPTQSPRFQASDLEPIELTTADEVYDDMADEVGDDMADEVGDDADSAGTVAGRFQPAGSVEELAELQQPFVGRWNNLISTTNWEKGRIISQWREALVEAGAPVTDYSDEAWANRVGGVTSPHVGRLRRVHDRFADQAETYPTLYWSHFLAGLDWDDAALWLQGAVEENWSISQMRQQRWKANGEVESDRPNGTQIIDVDMDEDTPDLGTAPAQGGTSKDYDGNTDGIASGPAYEAPDFGDESELAAMPENNHMNDGNQDDDGGGIATEPKMSPLQPFAGLPDLPDDMADVIESLKLAILRHKSAGFAEVQPETIRRYLEACGCLIES